MSPGRSTADRITKTLRSENERFLSWQRGEDTGCRVHRCLRLIRDRHADDLLSLSAAAKDCHLSSSQLNRLLLKYCGSTFKRILTSYRLWEAWRLLATTSLGVQEVARQTGFGDPRNMQRAFKRHLGVSPSGGRSMRVSVAHMLLSGLSEGDKLLLESNARTSGTDLPAESSAVASHGGEP